MIFLMKDHDSSPAEEQPSKGSSQKILWKTSRMGVIPLSAHHNPRSIDWKEECQWQ